MRLRAESGLLYKDSYADVQRVGTGPPGSLEAIDRICFNIACRLVSRKRGRQRGGADVSSGAQGQLRLRLAGPADVFQQHRGAIAHHSKGWWRELGSSGAAPS